MPPVTPPAPAKLLTARQVAERLSVGVRTLWRLIATRQFPQPALRINTRLMRWTESQVEDFIAALRQPT